MSWWRYAISGVRRPEDADDAVQDAVLRTLRAQPELESDEEVSRYVWAVVRTTSVPLIGKSRDAQPESFDEEEHSRPDRESSCSPLEILLGTEEAEKRARILAAALSELTRLPKNLRQAIELHVLREPPLLLREIAEIQSVAVSTVHHRIDRGVERLAVAISEKGPGRR